MKLKLFVLLILFSCSVFAQDSKENADFKLAVNLYNDKMYDLALEQLQIFINQYPGGVLGTEARFYLGLTQSQLGRHDEARYTFQNFALAYPDNIKAPEAWMNVAEEFAAMGNEREAAMGFERVRAFHPNSRFAPSALFKAADCYSRLKDTENTLRVLKILTQEYTTDEVLSARNKLAEVYISTGQFDQAWQESKRVIDATNNQQLKARALVLYGRAFKGLGRIDEAESAVSDVVENYKSTPSYYEALLTLGELKNSLGKTDEAFAVWKSVTDSSNAPGQIRQDVYIEMAETYSRLQSNKQALELFEKAVKTPGTRSGETSYKAGIAARKIGDHAKSVKFFAKALADSTCSVDRRAVIISAVESNIDAKNIAEAIRLIDLFRQDYPADENLPGLLITGAEAVINQTDEPRTAIVFCEFLIEFFPSNELVDDALMKLGEAWKKSGSMEKAIKAFEDLQRRYPASEFIPDAKKQIRLIKAFEMQNKETGLQKLALLIGDVISQKSKGNLAYRLAEIYFTDLKDYQLAAEQYGNAFNADLEDNIRPLALFRQAQSYEMLALKENERTANKKEYVSRSMALYDSLSALYPASDLGDKAAVSAFRLRLETAGRPEELRKLGAKFLSRYYGIYGGDEVILLLGDSYLRIRNYEDAAQTFRFILDKYPNLEAAKSAEYYLGIAMDAMMEKDTAFQVIEKFLLKNPNHEKSAAAAVYLAKSAADNGMTEKALGYFNLLEKKYFYFKTGYLPDAGRADAYFFAGDYKNAKELYLRSLDKLRSDFFVNRIDYEFESSVVYKLAVCYERLMDYSGAKKWYAEYVIRDRTSKRAGEAFYALAAMAKADNSLDLAARYMQEVSRISGKSNEHSAIVLETADMLFKNEQYADAIKRYNEAFARAKDDTSRQYIQSRIIVSYFRIDNIREADKRAAEFVKKYSKTYNYKAEFEFERGKYQMRKEDIVKARERFSHVVKAYPKSRIIPETMFWTARLYELDQKLPLAVRIYDSLLTHLPNDPIIPRVRLSLGNAYYNMEKLDAAVVQYQNILDNENISPDLVPLAMSNLIMTYKEMKKYDTALELARNYIERFPTDADLISKKIEIGVLYQKLGFHDRSILHLQSLLDEGNIDFEAELRYYIGEAYFYKGEYQQAILEYLKVPYIVTKHGKMDWISTSYYMAGQSYEKMSKYEQAITMYNQIINRKQTDPQFKTAAQKEIDRVKLVLKK
ncbi:MAG: tetratricopeptide repeat protein [Bacteroidetes bacterium]|nr:tetratricopeptide repeat protein [Bacteroidota bacterium]